MCPCQGEPAPGRPRMLAAGRRPPRGPPWLPGLGPLLCPFFSPSLGAAAAAAAVTHGAGGTLPEGLLSRAGDPLNQGTGVWESRERPRDGPRAWWSPTLLCRLRHRAAHRACSPQSGPPHSAPGWLPPSPAACPQEASPCVTRPQDTPGGTPRPDTRRGWRCRTSNGRSGPCVRLSPPAQPPSLRSQESLPSSPVNSTLHEGGVGTEQGGGP